MKQLDYLVLNVDFGGQEVVDPIAEREDHHEESQGSMIRLASTNASPGRVHRPPGVEH